jgi:cell wall-associated NlpC family hydrolase
MERLVALGAVSVLAEPEEGAELVTELVVGEEAEVRETSRNWYKVNVPGQESHLDVHGYPGWVSGSASTVRRQDWHPNATVASPNRAGLPLGARLERRDGGLFLPGGEKTEVEDHAVIPEGEGVRRSVVETAELFLGLPYRWGGTDSTQGADCSGMVFRVMQVHGTLVPRDADDQYDKASFKSEESWEKASPGDLIFFGEDSITHVGIYLGDGSYISEHGVGGTVIRGVTADPYWGFARY